MAFENRFYPHLLPDDIKVWKRFLAAHAAEYSHFDYDVRVGTGRDPGDDYPPNIRKMALDLSMRRIDAVGHQPGKLTIIEITRAAGMTAIGQLTTYPILYRQTFNPAKLIEVLLVAETLQSDVESALRLNQLPYLLFPE
jgi:hypothetical protein